MADTSDLYTTVKNTSGASRYFGYLYPHGKTLANGATTTVFGHIQHTLRGRLRHQTSLENDLLNNNIEILSTPKPVYLDSLSGTTLTNPTATASVAPSGAGATGLGTFFGANTANVFYTFEYAPYNAFGATLAYTSVPSAIPTFSATTAASTAVSSWWPQMTLPPIPANALGFRVWISSAFSAASAATAAAAVSAVSAGSPLLYGSFTTANGLTATPTAATATASTGTLLNLNQPTFFNGASAYSALLSACTATGSSATAIPVFAPPTANKTEVAAPRTQSYTNNVLGTTDPSWGQYLP